MYYTEINIFLLSSNYSADNNVVTYTGTKKQKKKIIDIISLKKSSMVPNLAINKSKNEMEFSSTIPKL